MTEMSIKCPICGRAVLVSDPNAPFCSDRCRLLDLGNWASGRYKVSVPTDQQEDEAKQPQSNEGEPPTPDGDR